MPTQPSWCSETPNLPTKVVGIIGVLCTVWGVRHIRWTWYFVRYYTWWYQREYVGTGLWHHREDVRFLKSIWGGLL